MTDPDTTGQIIHPRPGTTAVEKLRADGRNRTGDLIFTRDALSQLSYVGTVWCPQSYRRRGSVSVRLSSAPGEASARDRPPPTIATSARRAHSTVQAFAGAPSTALPGVYAVAPRAYSDPGCDLLWARCATSRVLLGRECEDQGRSGQDRLHGISDVCSENGGEVLRTSAGRLTQRRSYLYCACVPVCRPKCSPTARCRPWPQVSPRPRPARWILGSGEGRG
jgi:hypothetical protein